MIDTNQFHFNSAQEAWHYSIKQLFQFGSIVPGVVDKTSVGTFFGEVRRNTCELLATSFVVKNPRNRLMSSIHRPLNLSYAIANVIWVLTGSNDVEMISFYNDKGQNFSDDGITIPSAPGKRIFSPESKLNQFDRIIQKLKDDASSRRAIIQILLPSDITQETRDVSCLISLQFIIRNNELSCITYMRSQSALMVMPYDIFLFSMIQEAVAVSLGLELGNYYHICGSLHYYDDEEELLKKVIGSNYSIPNEMPIMEDISAETREALLCTERDIRFLLSKKQIQLIDFNQYNLDSYWKDLLKMMVRHYLIKNEKLFSPSQLSIFSDKYCMALEVT
ncbi:MAG: thymidylate synthase [Pyrinomonadaceae bacterium]